MKRQNDCENNADNTVHIRNRQPLAVCIHASMSSRSQWSRLVAEISGRMRVIAPDLIGYGASPRVRRGMRMQDEVDNILRQIETETGKDNGPLHLIGHSYGGAVALQIALMYPERVASLTVYEPAQFLLLFEDGLGTPEAHEILSVHRFVRARVRSFFKRRAAAKHFIEYWSGRGIWKKLPLKTRRRFVRLLPKVAAEFNAIFSAGVCAADCAALKMPVRVIFGSDTRASARRVSEVLVAAAPHAERIVVDGAAHMAAATRPTQINPLIVEHVFAKPATQKRAVA